MAASLGTVEGDMPEGDTIFRTAATLQRWVAGREVTAATTTVARLPAHKLVGQRIEKVEAMAKHLLIRFDSGSSLHTHMKMTGAWHVYSKGERWQRPKEQARFVLEAGDHVAVCFNAPVVELLAPKGDRQHPSLTNLGPDVLKPPIDLDEVRRRAATRPPATTIAELLLDQGVASGIGNIWRCEALFVTATDPFRSHAELTGDEIDTLVEAAAEMMGRSIAGRRDRPWVYGRARRPCYRCRTPVKVQRMGASDLPRQLYWCPKCQGPTGTTAAQGGT
jgi:endonuclease-8